MSDIECRAERGDIVLVKGISSSTSLRDGKKTDVVWNFGLVTNVTRKGEVSGYRYHGDSIVHKGIPMKCLIVKKDRLRGMNPEDVLAALPLEYPQHPWPKDFESVEEASASIKAILPPEGDQKPG